jgi:hypothetical protein
MIIRTLYQHAVKAPGMYCYTHMKKELSYCILYIPHFNQITLYISNN